MFFLRCQKNVRLIKDILKIFDTRMVGKSKDKSIIAFYFFNLIYQIIYRKSPGLKNVLPYHCRIVISFN